MTPTATATATAAESIRPDFRAVRLDIAKYCTPVERAVKYIRAIYDVYMYDHNEHTFCCETTPSFYLRHLYTTVDFQNDPSEEMIADIEETCCESAEDIYMHVSDIEKLPETDKRAFPKKSFEDAEEAREYMQGNYPF